MERNQNLIIVVKNLNPGYISAFTNMFKGISDNTILIKQHACSVEGFWFINPKLKFNLIERQFCNFEDTAAARQLEIVNDFPDVTLEVDDKDAIQIEIYGGVHTHKTMSILALKRALIEHGVHSDNVTTELLDPLPDPCPEYYSNPEKIPFVEGRIIFLVFTS